METKQLEKVCQHCGNTYLGKEDQKYCSDSCRVMAYRKRKDAQTSESPNEPDDDDLAVNTPSMDDKNEQSNEVLSKEKIEELIREINLSSYYYFKTIQYFCLFHRDIDFDQIQAAYEELKGCMENNIEPLRDNGIYLSVQGTPLIIMIHGVFNALRDLKKSDSTDDSFRFIRSMSLIATNFIEEGGFKIKTQ